MSILAALNVYHDDDSARSAGMNMAIDEALLEGAEIPSMRFYQWGHAALSFGYFGRFADVANYASRRDLVRRWTGGGIVFHGDDLTYSIVIPANDAAFSESTMSIYENVHRALRDALNATAQHAVVAAVADRGAGVSDAGYRGHCFANPVRADVLVNGRKVAGAAQRRTRAGLLHQGSIQHVDLGNGLAKRFATGLTAEWIERKLDEMILDRAFEIAGQKYRTAAWLRRR